MQINTKKHRFKEAWLSDPATYPIVIIISGAGPRPGVLGAGAEGQKRVVGAARSEGSSSARSLPLFRPKR
mgnify:CR=1 FL=1